jgi:endonuclease/exonuclease/phosphatase family metal-dependent hydrolase
MSYTPEFTETEKKNIESKKLLDYLASITSPFVIAGDLNAVPTSDLVTKLHSKYINLSPDLSEPTWTTKPFSHEGFEVDTLSYRLDYVFGSKKVEAISSKIINTEYSDHLPIITEVEVRN